MKPFQVVIDTNVFIAALRSQYGASHKLFRRLGSDKFEINLSVFLAIEYEEAAKNLVGKSSLRGREIEDILDHVCSVANRRKVYYLWRPFLIDPKDDMVLELAVGAGCGIMVTYNKTHFEGVKQFGIRVLAGQEFLQVIGELYSPCTILAAPSGCKKQLYERFPTPFLNQD
jgi:putative PIN family toxin of toxin-antitoxin system